MMLFIILSGKTMCLPELKISVFLCLNIGTLDKNLNKKPRII